MFEEDDPIGPFGDDEQEEMDVGEQDEDDEEISPELWQVCL